MTNQEKLQEVFSDKAYVESIAKMSAEDAAKSLNEKGVEVTADDLMKVRDFIQAHKEELQNGELTEKDLAEIAGGLSGAGWTLIGIGVVAVLSGGIGLFLSW
ncbi:hypothetical protein [Gemmiger sp.]